jgi:hypothetical protein
MNRKNIFILFFACFLLFGCGVKLPPEPLFATSPSNIDNEVTRRKNEKKKPSETENVTSTSESKDKKNPPP